MARAAAFFDAMARECPTCNIVAADVLDTPVVRPIVTETTALGAAYLAGLAVSFWGSVEEIRAQWQMERRFLPDMGEDEREERLASWRRAVERSFSWEE